jgi:hypothetical protein
LTKALAIVSPRLQPVVLWAHAIINHETRPPGIKRSTPP